MFRQRCLGERASPKKKKFLKFKGRIKLKPYTTLLIPLTPAPPSGPLRVRDAERFRPTGNRGSVRPVSPRSSGSFGAERRGRVPGVPDRTTHRVPLSSYRSIGGPVEEPGSHRDRRSCPLWLRTGPKTTLLVPSTAGARRHKRLSNVFSVGATCRSTWTVGASSGGSTSRGVGGVGTPLLSRPKGQHPKH